MNPTMKNLVEGLKSSLLAAENDLREARSVVALVMPDGPDPREGRIRAAQERVRATREALTLAEKKAADLLSEGELAAVGLELSAIDSAQWRNGGLSADAIARRAVLSDRVKRHEAACLA